MPKKFFMGMRYVDDPLPNMPYMTEFMAIIYTTTKHIPTVLEHLSIDRSMLSLLGSTMHVIELEA